MYSIYEINSEMERLIELHTDKETGELDHESMSQDVSEIALHLATKFKNNEILIQAHKEQALTQNKRKAMLEVENDRIKSTLTNMVAEGDKLSNSVAKIGWRKSSSVKINIPENELPHDFIRTSTAPRLADLTKAIKLGIEVRGVELIENQNIQIR